MGVFLSGSKSYRMTDLVEVSPPPFPTPPAEGGGWSVDGALSDAETLVLPSHGLPFRGLHARLGQLRDHHAARLGEALDALREPRSAAPHCGSGRRVLLHR